MLEIKGERMRRQSDERHPCIFPSLYVYVSTQRQRLSLRDRNARHNCQCTLNVSVLRGPSLPCINQRVSDGFPCAVASVCLISVRLAESCVVSVHIGYARGCPVRAPLNPGARNHSNAKRFEVSSTITRGPMQVVPKMRVRADPCKVRVLCSTVSRFLQQ